MNKKLFVSLRWMLIPMLLFGFSTMFFPAKKWVNDIIPHPLAFGWGCGSLLILFMHTTLSCFDKYLLKSEKRVALYSSFRFVLIPSVFIGLTLSFLCTAKKSIVNLSNPYMVGYTLSAFLVLFAHCIFCYLGSRKNEQELN